MFAPYLRFSGHARQPSRFSGRRRRPEENFAIHCAARPSIAPHSSIVPSVRPYSCPVRPSIHPVRPSIVCRGAVYRTGLREGAAALRRGSVILCGRGPRSEKIVSRVNVCSFSPIQIFRPRSGPVSDFPCSFVNYQLKHLLIMTYFGRACVARMGSRWLPSR